ncbi:MAG: HDOD domain-containing protein [Acidobacteriota bacterium]
MAAIDQTSYDVVVTDMRMPDVDGGDVLDYVRARQPQAIRIVLTGQADTAAGLRTAGTAHQCLPKPCSAAMLSGNIASVLACRGAIEDTETAAAITALGRLPSDPEACERLRTELAGPHPSTQQIAAIAAADLGMTCKLLQVANSGFFGPGGRAITTVGHAVRSIGGEVVRQLAAGAAFVPWADIALGAQLAEASSRDRPDETPASPETASPSPSAVGAVVLALVHGGRYWDTIAMAQTDARPRPDIERAELGASREDAGAYLLALWGIPAAPAC